jgi:type I restriction enzyme, S subunit
MSLNGYSTAPPERKKLALSKGRSDEDRDRASQDTADTNGAQEASRLPKGWRWVTLGDVAESMKNGIYKPASSYTDDGLACLRMYNIGEGKIVWRDIKRMRLSEAEIRDYELLPGDLLVNRVNSRELVGKSVAIPTGLERCVFESKNIRVRIRCDLASPEFVSYRLLSAGSRYFSQNAQQVVGMASISQPQVARFPLPLPPLPEQRRIVAEIEKQFTRLEAGVAALRRVQANLKRYRATVLKAASEGRLVPTEAELARSQRGSQDGKPVYETGEALLARILAGRRQNWQGRGQYKEPAAPDTVGLRPLPDRWIWATVEQLSARVQYGSSAKTNDDSTGVPVLRMGNIQEGKFDFAKLKFLPKSHDEFPELLLAGGDLLFNRTNSVELVGKTAVFKGTPHPCSFASYLIRVRFGDGCHPDYVSYFINSVFGRAWIVDVVSQQVGQANVNGTKLQALPIPLPPIAEQTRIVAEVERRLSVVEGLETVVSANLQRATRLRQSILQKAFSGDLG